MRYLVVAIFSLLNLCAQAQGFLKAQGPAIINGNGKEMILRGIGLGGWMLQEPYMLKLSGSAVAQYDIRKKITTLVGKKNTQKFYDAWLNNHCTKADIDSLAAWGFNSVRLPIHYNLFTLSIEEEPVKGKNTWLKQGFRLTDSLLSWCKANHIYLILDLHATPGGQGNDNAISDRDTSQLSLWQNEANQSKTIALWKELANRYKEEEWIGAYDLVNEPNWGFQNAADKNGCNETANEPLKKLYKDITAAIRQVDKKHIIIIEGNCWGNNYEGIFPLWDDNIVISFHKYWNFNTQGSLQKMLDYRDKYNVPLWLGETGENSNAWFTDMISLVEKNKIGWAMWPLKKSGINNPLQVKINPGAQKIIDYFNGKGTKPASAVAFKSLMQLASDTRIENNIIHRDVIDAMMRQVSSTETISFKQNIIKPNSILYATDYDMGNSGVAYHDKDSAEYWVSTNTRTGWNTGDEYRNDGVDIGTCSDAVSNGFNVNSIETGEWMQYSIYVAANTIFDVSIRYAAKENSGQLKLLLNEEFVSENCFLPKTAGTQNWKTSIIKSVKFNKGWNRLRVLATNGGFSLNYLQFLSPGNNITAK